MSAAVVPLAASVRRPWFFPWFVGASLLLHAFGLFLAARTRPSDFRPPKPSEVVVVEVERPAPPPPPPHIELRPHPVQKYTGEARTHAQKEPPPPNDTPPPDATPPPPVVVGLTLESTTTASTVSVPVGNTLVGKPEARGAAPGSVRPGYAPSYLVDTLPVLLEEINGEEIYPRQARKLGITGQVVLAITVEADGRVSAARVVSGPGYGLNEAAQGAVLRARFKPATKGGEPVATDLRYTYTFALN